MDRLEQSRPNILFIQSDQHSADVLGCYGDPVVRTPNLDRLASRGGRLTSAYCASPICVPSRASLLTGRHPHENEVWTNSHILSSAIPTMANSLGAAGYRPVQIGRMHFVGPDQLHGFAERYVGDHGPNFLGGRPVDHGILTGTAGPHRVSLTRAGYGQSAYEVHDEYVTATAVDFLNRRGIAKRTGQSHRPFCLFVGYMLPHQPFVARKADFDLYGDSVPLPRLRPPQQEHAYLQWWRKHAEISDVPESETRKARTAYWALVTRLDTMIGQVLRALEVNNLEDDTLIVYTTDHGEQAGERGLWWKQTFYEQAVRVPMLVSWPGHVAQGAVCERVLSHLDLNATLLDVVKAPGLPRSRGRSFLKLLDGEKPGGNAWEDVAFSEYCTESGDPAHSDGTLAFQQRMIRLGEWKLIYYHGYEPQLFNLRNDPDEIHDLAAVAKHRSIREELTARVSDGWDAEQVKARIEGLSAERDLLKSWAQNVEPEDLFRWDLHPEMDQLAGP